MVEIKVNDELIPFQPGDRIDLGKNGIIDWIPEPLAGAQRIITAEAQKETRRIMESVEERVRKALKG